MPIVRNAIPDGTTYSKRFVAHVGQPPIVFLGEKGGGPVRIPQQEAMDEVAWIPHYSGLGVLVGIGIAGNEATFFTQTVQGREAEATFNLGTVVGRGRWITYFPYPH